MIDVHVAVDPSNNDVAILLKPEGIFLPASLVPTVFTWSPCRRHMTHQDGLHIALPEKLQLYSQPLKVLVPRLRFGCTTVDRIVRVEEVKGVEADDGKLIWNDLDEEPSTSFKSMALFLRDKFAPDVGVALSPSVGTLGENIMRKDIVVAEVGHDGYGEVVGGIGVIDVVVLAKHLDELLDEHLIQPDDLSLAAWDELVVIVTSGIAGPDDEVDGIFEIVVDPLESSIDQGEGGITIGFLGAEDAGIARAPVASIIAVCGGELAVEWVWVEICMQ
ncbi:MAG: hypothetical protein Q9198_001250 [Flavoplaca austrocitrina]